MSFFPVKFYFTGKWSAVLTVWFCCVYRPNRIWLKLKPHHRRLSPTITLILRLHRNDYATMSYSVSLQCNSPPTVEGLKWCRMGLICICIILKGVQFVGNSSSLNCKLWFEFIIILYFQLFSRCLKKISGSSIFVEKLVILAEYFIYFLRFLFIFLAVHDCCTFIFE